MKNFDLILNILFFTITFYLMKIVQKDMNKNKANKNEIKNN